MIHHKITILSLYKKILQNYQNNNNFVIFKKPNEKKIYFYSNDNKIKNNFFLIHSFNQKKTIKIYPKKIYYVELQKIFFHQKKIILYKNFLTKKFSFQYANLIRKAIEFINKNNFMKVVVSKSIEIPFKNLCIKNTFKNLIVSYPNNLISLWYDIDYGLWIGSTPELLIKYKKKSCKINVLAGTNWGNKNWTKKEFIEHQIVVKYVIQLLKYYKGTLYIDKMKTVHVGFLNHLKTDIYFFFKKMINPWILLKNLYPTPSICGFPKKESNKFILENENYERDFYTGYIGFVNQNDLELYINIKCAKIKNKKVTLYAGSGILKNSNLDQEYLETDQKINSLLYNFFFSNKRSYN